VLEKTEGLSYSQQIRGGAKVDKNDERRGGAGEGGEDKICYFGWIKKKDFLNVPHPPETASQNMLLRERDKEGERDRS
jgi:hypothetical protein